MSASETPNAFNDERLKVGAWTEIDTHGGVMTGEYVDGQRTGVWRHVASDGRLRSEGTYQDGMLHGKWVWYRASGLVMQKGAFDHHRKHGRWERWDAKGNRLPTVEWAYDKKQN